MPATPVSKEAIRLLAIQFGVREAARRSGLNENTVVSWSKRHNWFTQPPKQTDAITAIKPAGDVLLDELAGNERETKLSLSRYTKRASKDAENAKLRDAPYVKQVAQTAGITFKWNDREQNNNTVVNIALLGVDPEAVRAVQDNVQALDVDSVVSE